MYLIRINTDIMDIDLLAKMVKELILDNDRVVLPGLGAFVAEVVPSTFSDRGYTINPPYRKLYFRARPDEGQELADFYARSNNIAPEIADKIIKDFVLELKDVLFAKKTVVFPGLGRLRATKENAVFFVADEDLDIYPEGFALEPVSLKTHVETPEDITAVVADLKAVIEEEIVVEEHLQEQPAVEEASVDEASVEETAVEETAVEEEVTATGETVEEAPEEVTFTEESTEESVGEEPAEEHEEETIEAEPAVEPAVEPETAEVTENIPAKKCSFWKTLGKVLLWLIIAAALLLGAFIAVSRYQPQLLDSILYTPEELEIING